MVRWGMPTDRSPRTVRDLAISRAGKDGAFYILRADGQRWMMIETILCGRDGPGRLARGDRRRQANL